MKKLSRSQKDRWTKLSKRRHQKELKRVPHRKIIMTAMKKINRIQKQLEQIRYLQAKQQ
jgi:hypothetical protein